MEIDKAIRECEDSRLKTKYTNAIYVIQRALTLYSIQEVALSFNGGKDSTVLLHLLRAGYFLHRAEESCSQDVVGENTFPIRTIYFESASAFPEINSFTYETAATYNLQMDIIRLDFKSGLEALLKANPIRAIFLGVRIGDPTAVGQEQFSPSSPGWPAFMRVNPILDWSYRDVWAFLLVCEVRYCSLYDQGYTSIGSIHDTVPNALLCISNSNNSEEKFKPAYLLPDGRLERAGRAKKQLSSISNGLKFKDLNSDSVLTASVIAVGDEILFGTVEDKLWSLLCRKLHSIGWAVSLLAVTRNDIDSVAEEVERRKSTDDMVFIYGGVGPLHSDVTVAGVAKAFGVRMAPDEEFEEHLRHLIDEKCTSDKNGKRRCKALKHRISTLSTTTQSSWKTTLLRLINSELSFLNRVNSSPLKLSTNIGYLESVVHVFQHPLITSVSRVCKPISISSKVPQQSIYVDIICSFNGNPVWFIVSDRNPRYISWQDSEKTKNNKGLRNRIVHLMVAAEESCVTVRPCSIILFFSNGLQSCIIEKLKYEFGATTDLGFGFSDFDCEFYDDLEDGDWVSVLGKSFEKACVLEIKIGSFSPINKDGQILADQSGNLEKVHIKDVSYDVNLGESFIALVSALRSWSPFDVEEAELVNFDTTALVAIVSGISNGGIDRILATPESELRNRFKGNYEFMIGQVNSEMEKPIHKELMPVILQKRGIICESVCSEFQELVSMCGGPNEKSRAKHFLNHLRVVPDCPSERLMSLPTTRKLALKNKVVFGTGDYWHAPTITANMAFVRAVSQTGMSLFTIEHRPRALVGD